MTCVVMIDPDRAAMERVGLECLQRGVAVALAENIPEAVRELSATPAALIVVDVTLVRLTPVETAILFERVAPGVPVVVAVRAETALDVRVAFELVGFRVMTAPVAVEDLLDKVGVADAGPLSSSASG
jgi:DNA-binding NtrC family response regulator